MVERESLALGRLLYLFATAPLLVGQFCVAVQRRYYWRVCSAAGKSHLANFAEIWRNPVWFSAFVNSLNYVVLNTLISLVAVPAAMCFRYRFLGDRQLFFWLLTNRIAPPAVFLLPFFQLYSAVGLFDTPLAVALAHCLFTVPLSVWILEGFMSGVPTELDDMARIDGHSFSFFFLRIFVPVNRGAIEYTVLLLHVQLGRTAAGANTYGQ